MKTTEHNVEFFRFVGEKRIDFPIGLNESSIVRFLVRASFVRILSQIRANCNNKNSATNKTCE
jgi:hypothetical protein